MILILVVIATIAIIVMIVMTEIVGMIVKMLNPSQMLSI